MTNRTAFFLLVAALCIGLFGFTFLAAPHACEWGLSAYFWSGVGVVIALLVLPFVFHREQSLLKRGLFSLGLCALGVVVWWGGLFIANVRILCRLF
jgi:multidrug transporter EmrE-like cation transporter